MHLRLRFAAAVLAMMVAAASTALAQQVQGAGLTALRVTVLDQTDAALVSARVTITGAAGVAQSEVVDGQGVAQFEELAPGAYQVSASADGFRSMLLPVTVRRGQNQATLRLAVASIEESVVVQDEGADARRDNGFTQTLSQDEIDALSDDPDEMAQQLMDMAGPGAQIFVDGFRGGRLPPKDQIQQIRFHSNSFSAEYHDAGMVRIEVITRPGMGGFRGHFNVGFRDESLNAKNAFAESKGAEQLRRFTVNFQGPLAKGKTSLSISADGNSSFDSKTIVAASPTGDVFDQVRQPTDGLNTTVRVDHQLNAGNQLRAEYSRRNNSRSNLGVGDFDLPSRAFGTDSVTDTLRVRNTRVINKKLFSELKLEVSNQHTDTSSVSADPAVRVLEAFTLGGAGQSGTRAAKQFELEQNVDFAPNKKHAMRAGVLVEGGWWDSTTRSNANGTYTFSSLADYNAGRPSTFTQRIGDPLVTYSLLQAGWYVQDDIRLRKTLSLSLGARQEVQAKVADTWNVAPRAAVTWNATKTTVVRGGYGWFYDWYDSSLYEQTVRVDGTHQIDVVVTNPAYPSVSGVGNSLPPSVIRAASLTQPLIQQASIGVERPLTPWLGLRTDYMWTRASDVLRSVNVNAPLDGVRPNPAVGNITEIRSIGKRASDRLTVATNIRVPSKRIFGNVMYQLASTRNFADSATSLPSNSHDPNADWGPSAQDVRHRVFLMLNTPIGGGVRAGFNMQGSSALPYTITTGRDENGDTVFNDRPAGVSRNSARGAAQWNASLRLNKSIGLGGARTGGGDGGIFPMPVPPGGGGALNQRGPGGGGPGGPGGGDGPQMFVMEGNNSKYRLDLYVNFQNLFNTVNYNAFVGNLLSPFYGAATSAGPPRRVEIGASIGF